MNITYCRNSKEYKDRLELKFTEQIKEVEETLKLQIEKINNTEKEYDQALQQYKQDKLEIKKKFIEKAKEILNRRNEEIKKLSELNENTFFWLKVLLNSKGTNNLITPKDYEVLKNIINININYTDEELRNFKISLEFKENEYFNNQAIEKEYIFSKDNHIEKIVSTKIDWKEGKNYFGKTIKKKIKNTKTNEVKEIESTKNSPSFFNFFYNLEFPKQEELKKMSFEKEKEFFEFLDDEFQTGKEIRDEIIPHASEYFVGIMQDTEIFGKYLEKNLTEF